MATLSAESADPAAGSTSGYGSAATGSGVDVVLELERLRASLVALAERFEDLRAKHNAHTHAGAVVAPPVGEQSAIAYIPT